MTHIVGMVRALLLDIEGTTTPLSFVADTLFPYARAHLSEFLSTHGASSDVQSDLALLHIERDDDLTRGFNPPPLDGGPDTPLSVIPYLNWLMDQDRKSTGLKALQGRVWQQGYRSGQLRSHVFTDVAPAFIRWRGLEKRICIYSSGSVLAQRLLFGHTEEGDLTPYIDGYFDTTIGAKMDAASYTQIAGGLELPLSEVLFLSDAVGELDAAQSAGMQAICLDRPGNRPLASSFRHSVVHSFNEIAFG